MRLLITLTPLQNTPQPINQYYLQSFFYSTFIKLDRADIHEQEKFKYFCFSNIFPYTKNKPFQENTSLKLIFSTVDNNLGYSLLGYLNTKLILNLGSYKLIKDFMEESQYIPYSDDLNM